VNKMENMIDHFKSKLSWIQKQNNLI
jgi:hypothetical protein